MTAAQQIALPMTRPRLSVGLPRVTPLVNVFVGEALSGTATADALGNWTYSIPAIANDSTIGVSASAADAAGNVSAASEAISITIDTTTAVPTIDLAAGSDTGSITDDNITNATMIDLNGTAEANADVEVVLTPGDITMSATADDMGAWSITGWDVSAVADGDAVFSATSTDIAANESDAGSLTVTIDTTAPTISLADPDDADAVVDEALAVAFELSESIPVADFDAQVSINPNLFNSVSQNGLVYTVTTGAPSNKGEYTITIADTLADVAGNTLQQILR